jgi:hypothetical protein
MGDLSAPAAGDGSCVCPGPPTSVAAVVGGWQPAVGLMSDMLLALLVLCRVVYCLCAGGERHHAVCLKPR